MNTDFHLQDEGTIAILTPLTKEAEEWVDEHLPEDATRWGQGVVIEHRFVATILNALAVDGFSIG